MNPQISYGEDVISRIVAASKSEENTLKLQTLLTEAVSELAIDLCAEIKADPTNIVEAVVVGNTAIHHLFLHLPVKQLGLAPYVPAVRSSLDLKAREVGLKIAPGAYVHLLPNVAGYVGADHVAMLLATRIAEADKTTLAIDIGTNTEICLTHRGHMTSVSCASGPAFEGAHIKFGMRAAPGAIEHVRLSSDRLEIQTIGGEAPVGICGSGLLDVVAQLRLHSALDRSGRMDAGAHSRIRNQNGMTEFVLAEHEGQEPITVSQKDVRELQLAKAAIRLGIQVLVIAGAFGTYINIESAITIGMLPSLSFKTLSKTFADHFGSPTMGGKRAAKSQKTFQLFYPYLSGIANRRKQFFLIREHNARRNVMKVGGGFLHGQQQEKSFQHKTRLRARWDSDPGLRWRGHSIVKEIPAWDFRSGGYKFYPCRQRHKSESITRWKPRQIWHRYQAE